MHCIPQYPLGCYKHSSLLADLQPWSRNNSHYLRDFCQGQCWVVLQITSCVSLLCTQAFTHSTILLHVWCHELHIMYEYYTRRDHGTVDLSGSEISLRVGVVVGVDHLTLSSTDCSFNVNNLKVKFHGGARSVNSCTKLFTQQILSSLY